MKRHELDGGTVLSVHSTAGSDAVSLAVLFDGRPMTSEAIPETILALQKGSAIPTVTVICVESIEDSTPRGATRVASLTDPAILDRFVESLEGFLEREVAVPAESAHRVVLGHSLGGNAALYVACHWPHLFGRVATGSAALQWPGDAVQMPGSRVVSDHTFVLRAEAVGCRPEQMRTPSCSQQTGISGNVPTARGSTWCTESSPAGTSCRRGEPD